MIPAAVQPLGVIGLGLVGSALVEVLHQHGLALVGYDIRPNRLAALEQYALQPARSPRAVAQRCRWLLLSLPHSGVSSAVVEGVEGLVDALQPGSLIMDTTTGDPQAMAALAARLAKRGVAYLDVTLGGSSDELRQGRVVLMVGGNRKAFLQCEPLLRLLAGSIFYMGDSGKGAQAKLIYNLVLGLNRAVLAEALSLGEQAGMDLQELLRLLCAGSTYSRAMDSKGQKMLAGEYTPVAKLQQHLKDVNLMLEMGRRLDASLPLTALHAKLLQLAVEAGMGEWDNAAIFEVYRRLQAGSQAPGL